MRIVLMCDKVERIAERKYRSWFRQLPHGQSQIQAELDCPTVPGTKYSVLLKGIFPSFQNNQECVTDLLSFSSGEHLKAISLTEEAKAEEGK